LEPFTKLEELRILIKELGYRKTKQWTFQKDVTDLLWVELEFKIRGWKRYDWPHLAGSMGDRRSSRIVADTIDLIGMSEPVLDRDHRWCGANILPNVPEIGRELFGRDWIYTHYFTNSTYPQLEHQTRTLDHYMVTNISEATIDRLVWRNNIMDDFPSSVICHLLGHGRYDEAVKHYFSHRIVDTENPGIRIWLVRNGLIEGPEDPWAEERTKALHLEGSTRLTPQ
jgi:hypothetical protein